jgi:outer membrane protein TolC
MTRTCTALVAVCLAMLTASRDAAGQGSHAQLGAPTEWPPPPPLVVSQPAPPPEPAPPPKSAPPPTLPISLPAALQLANVRPLDIQLAQQRLEIAAAQLGRAEVLWLPTIYLGADYFRHDGQLQDVVGSVFPTSKSNLMVGAGPSAVFATTDAIFGPLAARQDVRAQGAALQAVRNDSLLAVAEAYFNVQQARGELMGAETTLEHAEELVKRTDKLAPGLIPPVEAVRARTELAERRQAVSAARERWRVSSAELSRILRLATTLPVQPVEPPWLQMTLVRPDVAVDELVPLALTNRPELASRQAVIQATLQRLRQEKLRPLMPSILLRGASTNPGGTLAGGVFGGGVNERIGDFHARGDFDLQIIWELQNLGFGNCQRVREKTAEYQLAVLELFRTQDQIAAEVTQAHAQLQEAATRVQEAEDGLKLAADSVRKNFDEMKQIRELGKEVVLLLVRPQEVVAAIQALARANNNYYAAVADYDRAQFRLYRALGQPAQALGHPDSYTPYCAQ